MSNELEEIKEVINGLSDIYVMAIQGQRQHPKAGERFGAIKVQSQRASDKLSKLLRSLADTSQHKTQPNE